MGWLNLRKAGMHSFFGCQTPRSFTVSEKGGKGCWDMNAPGSLSAV